MPFKPLVRTSTTAAPMRTINANVAKSRVHNGGLAWHRPVQSEVRCNRPRQLSARKAGNVGAVRREKFGRHAQLLPFGRHVNFQARHYIKFELCDRVSIINAQIWSASAPVVVLYCRASLVKVVATPVHQSSKNID